MTHEKDKTCPLNPDLIAHELTDAHKGIDEIKEQLKTHNTMHESHMNEIKDALRKYKNIMQTLELRMTEYITTKEADQKYASKNVENNITWGVRIIIGAFLMALTVLLWPQQAHALIAYIQNFI